MGLLIDSGQASFLAAAMLRKFEGLRLTPYLCPAGKLTVGYGHVILSNERDLRAEVTVERAEALLLNDLAWAMFAVRKVGRVLADGQAAALASLVFNIGGEAWLLSEIRSQVKAGDMIAAAAQFGRWNKVKGVPNAGLTARRFREKQIFEGQSWNG